MTSPSRLVWARRGNVADGNTIEELKNELPDLPLPTRSSSRGQAPWEERFRRMYARYYPEGGSSVPMLLASCPKGQEEVMMMALVRKYGPEPDLTQPLYFGDTTQSSELRKEVLRYAKQVLQPVIHSNSLPKQKVKAILTDSVSGFFAGGSQWNDDAKGVLTNTLLLKASEALGKSILPDSPRTTTYIASPISDKKAELMNMRVSESDLPAVLDFMCGGTEVAEAMSASSQDPSVVAESVLDHFLSRLPADQTVPLLKILAHATIVSHLKKFVPQQRRPDSAEHPRYGTIDVPMRTEQTYQPYGGNSKVHFYPEGY
eukprot:TRINITY_DN19282_c0_g1_i2.p1 TRINITY_DN19282_c0_g1~~TRINITY_DN19282_c0_g1_i2.p1  ORF type:complete len:316 (+),score=44.66 TRINITY_DN19282_c0_g1_i2:81-1028(+)